MEKLDISNLIKYLTKNNNPEINNIYYALELLSESIKQTKSVVEQSTKINMTNYEYSEILEIANKIQETEQYIVAIESIENSLDDYLDLFSDVDGASSNAEDSDDERVIPNYQEYQLNQDIPHLLSESFMFKKICGFMMDGIRYNVDNWKNTLIKISEILISKDRQKFISIVKSKLFQGRKINVFSFTDMGNDYYVKLSNANIYVWTNRSVNSICAIIRKLLVEYNIPINSVYIYLRADYTPLHNGAINTEAQLETDKEQIKIGQFVRINMRNLSNNKYAFSKDMITRLTDSEQTKLLFGTKIPFFKEVTENSDVSTLAKNSSGYYRYWLEIFEFNGRKFLINSQWTKHNSERFHSWFEKLPNKK